MEQVILCNCCREIINKVVSGLYYTLNSVIIFVTNTQIEHCAVLTFFVKDVLTPSEISNELKNMVIYAGDFHLHLRW